MESVGAKPLICSRLQSVLGFTGVYLPFTGEANVNIDAPACLVPATIAHEMSHQRMVALEDRGQLRGYRRLRHLSMTRCSQLLRPTLMGLIHQSNALYAVSRLLVPDLRAVVHPGAVPGLGRTTNAYWRSLSSPVEEVAEGVTTHFLKGNDQELGIHSYGACVDLPGGLLRLTPAGIAVYKAHPPRNSSEGVRVCLVIVAVRTALRRWRARG